MDSTPQAELISTWTHHRQPLFDSSAYFYRQGAFTQVQSMHICSEELQSSMSSGI